PEDHVVGAEQAVRPVAFDQVDGPQTRDTAAPPEHGHIVAELFESLSQKVDDSLDAAVTLWWNRKPGGRHQCDAHQTRPMWERPSTPFGPQPGSSESPISFSLLNNLQKQYHFTGRTLT